MVQRFPHGVAVNVVHGLGAQGGPVEVGQNGIVEGDVGLLGIEQDPVAIKGYQLEQVVDPMGRRNRFARRCHHPGPEAAKSFIKNIYITRFISIINAIREKGARSGGGKSAGNFWVPAVSLQLFSMNLLKNLPTSMFVILSVAKNLAFPGSC